MARFGLVGIKLPSLGLRCKLNSISPPLRAKFGLSLPKKTYYAMMTYDWGRHGHHTTWAMDWLLQRWGRGPGFRDVMHTQFHLPLSFFHAPPNEIMLSTHKQLGFGLLGHLDIKVITIKIQKSNCINIQMLIENTHFRELYFSNGNLFNWEPLRSSLEGIFETFHQLLIAWLLETFFMWVCLFS